MASDAVEKMDTPQDNTTPEVEGEAVVETVENPSQGEIADATPETATSAAEASASPTSIADLSLKQEVTGKVLKVVLAGAFIEIGLNTPAFLHISQLSSERVKNVTDVINEGDDITAYVLDLDREKGRVTLTMLKPPALLWSELQHMVNGTVSGTIVRIEKFGAFVDIGAERPGLIHVSELSDEYVGSPDSVVSVGDEVEARIIGVDVRKKQVDLSLKAAAAPAIAEDEDDGEEPMTAMEIAMRRAMDRDGKKRRRDKKNHNRDKQSDIIARTLQHQRNSK